MLVEPQEHTVVDIRVGDNPAPVPKNAIDRFMVDRSKGRAEARFPNTTTLIRHAGNGWARLWTGQNLTWRHRTRLQRL